MLSIERIRTQQPAVFGNEQKKEAIHETQELTVEVVGRKKASRR
jgi:hypothetical protein